MFGRVACCLLLSSLWVWAGWLGPNLTVNPGFEEAGAKVGTARGWTRQILMPGGQAHLQTGNDQTTGSRVLETWFTSMERAAGARFFQKLSVRPGRVYRLSYEYRSDWDGRLVGDVMLTGTASGLYDIMFCPPNAHWTKVVRYIPIGKSSQERTTVGIYVQNRSLPQLRYDNVSFQETDLELDDIISQQVKVTLHPLTDKDVFLMPDYRGKLSFIVQVILPSCVPEAGLVLEARMVQGRSIRSCGEFPVSLAKDHTMRISVPGEFLEKGKGSLVAVLKGSDGTVYQHGSIALERIADLSQMNSVDLESGPFILHHGKPFFPIAYYGTPYQYDSKAKQAGISGFPNYMTDIKPYKFNTVQTYGFGGYAGMNKPVDIDRQLAFLDAAQKSGHMVMVELPRTLVEHDRQKDLEQWIRTMDSHPAVLYYRSEEMLNCRRTPMKYLVNAFETIRRINKTRQYILYDSLKPSIIPYLDGYDGTGLNNRFIASESRRLLGKDRVMLATINVEWPDRKSPSMSEQRYHTFMPVIHGARGIAFFMWSIARFKATDPDYVHRIGRSVNELAEVVPALTGAQPLPAWYPQITKDSSVSMLRVSNGKDHWLLAGPALPMSRGHISFKVPEHIRVKRCFEEDRTYGNQRAYSFEIQPQRVLILKFMENRIR